MPRPGPRPLPGTVDAHTHLWTPRTDVQTHSRADSHTSAMAQRLAGVHLMLYPLQLPEGLGSAVTLARWEGGEHRTGFSRTRPRWAGTVSAPHRPRRGPRSRPPPGLPTSSTGPPWEAGNGGDTMATLFSGSQPGNPEGVGSR